VNWTFDFRLIALPMQPSQPPPDRTPEFTGHDLPVEIGVHELKLLLAAGEPLELVDCREADEFAFCRIPSARSLPTSAIRDWLPGFSCPATRPLVVYCHHGIRSFHVVSALRASGLRQARSLAGGIEAWSLEVDPAVPRY
jgi:rhodanese-related sulfurtransferase